jgi:hypothetical protein
MILALKNKIPNYKHQITNKSQIPIFNDKTRNTNHESTKAGKHEKR